MIILYLPVVLISVASFLYWFVTRNFSYWKNRKIAGPEPVALFGNLKETALRRKYIGLVFKKIYDDFNNEKLVGVYRMTTPCVLIRDLDIIKHIMIKDFDCFSDRGVEFSKEGLGANLFHADGETWRVLRTKLSPIFTSGKLKNMFHLVSERGDRFIEYFTNCTENQTEHDMQSISRMFAMSTIAACAFGLDIDFNDPKMQFLRKLDALILTANYANEADMMFPGILRKINMSRFPAEVTAFFSDLVQTVFAQRNGVPTNRNDFMDLIIEMRQQKVIQTNKNIDKSTIAVEFTDDMIAAQAFVFYVAGFETSSTTVTFLLYELTRNPEIQDKLISEIDETLRKNGGKITYDSLMDMPYLTKCFDETLRKYPIVDPLQRNAQKDYKVPGTDLIIKKGQTVLIPLLGIHWDEKYYPNPEVFDPERFSAENSHDRHSCAYLPFGTGPRNCIGLRFAKVQSRMLVVKLLLKFRVEASPNTPKTMEFDTKRVLMGPKNGMPIKIINRYG